MTSRKPSCKQGPSTHGAKFLGLFLLWRLNRSPAYGYLLLSEMKSFGMAVCKPNTIYSILAKLERRGFIRSKSDIVSGRTRKIYSTTSSGRALLERIKKEKIKGLLREFMKSLIS